MGNYVLLNLLILFYLCVVNVSSIYIDKNAYKGISISISGTVKEQDFNFEKLKTVLTKSSDFIYHATRKRSYFGEFIISLPSSWTGHPCQKEDFTTEVSQKVDVYLKNSAQDPHLTTKHSRGCGLEGDRIDMPLEWLNENSNAESLAHQFVQQWSIYRYGVFEEKPIRKDSCYSSSGTLWKPVGCYNTKSSSEPTLENGLPVCSLPSDFLENKELRSSLMFASSKALDFCDGSSSFPHNPAMPTLHNTLCKGRTVWSVIENSLDFKYGRNLPLKADKPPKTPMFKCFREERVHVTFAIQTNTVKNLPIEVMTQIGSILYEFLWNMARKDSKATLVTFTDKEDPNKPLDLDITNSTELYRQLQIRVRTARRINNVCLSCGLQKALNATLESSSSLPIVVVIAWKSTMVEENPSGLAEIIRNYPNSTTLHLILVEEDTAVEDIPTEIIQAVRSLGGLIYSLPKELVFRASKLLVILGAVVKNPLQVEDRVVVVHEKSYRDVSKNFVDSFITPPGEFSKMLYVMYCSLKVDSVIRSDNKKCASLSAASDADSKFKCGEVWVFSDKKASEKKWEYPFSYLETPDPLHCSSVALLLSSPAASSTNSFTLKGWLSEYVVKVPQNAVIVYVEITGSPGRMFYVMAQISGPGLKSPVSLELRDNGNGDPDTKAGDGIYSRYFTEFSEKGIYTVTVSAEMSMNKANSFFAENLQPENKLVQSKTIGFFYVSDSVPELDILPPNRVADLSVESINHEESTAILQWTAPGGNYDSGKATAYEIKYSQQPSSLSDLYFNEDENLLPPDTNAAINPNTTGYKELVLFQFPKTNTNEIYYVALRAVDENNNKGDISNIIQVYFNLSGKETTFKSTSSTDATKLASSDPTSPDMVNITDATVSTTDVSEISSTSDDNTTISPPRSKYDEFFDKKTIIILSSTGGIFLLIIIINIIICCCCIKKIKRSPKPRKLSRRDSLRPPYNVNIAYQEGDRHSSSNSDNFMGVSMSSLADQNEYTAPETRTKPSQRKYSYHTDKSLRNKAKKDSELGFKLVQTQPAYASSSISRYDARRSREPDTESETEYKSAIPQPQTASGVKDPQIYSLGVV